MHLHGHRLEEYKTISNVRHQKPSPLTYGHELSLKNITNRKIPETFAIDIWTWTKS